MPEFEPIVGRYAGIDMTGETHRIFVEEAGSGVPLLYLHTARNDSQCDVEVCSTSKTSVRISTTRRDRVWHRWLET
jgi:hypothetical protein